MGAGWLCGAPPEKQGDGSEERAGKVEAVTDVQKGTDYNLELDLAENLNNVNILDFYFAFYPPCTLSLSK